VNPLFVLRRKILATITVIIVLLPVLNFIEVAVGADGTGWTWWNSSWKHRMPITVLENSGNNLIDYQVFVSVDTASLIETGKMQANGSDIRFTDSAGDEMPYWIESEMNSSNTVILIKMPNISASSKEIIYMYYGNPTATSTSNASAVFDFFDDFLGTELDSGKWTGQSVWKRSDSNVTQKGTGYVTVENSTCYIVAPKTGQSPPWDIQLAAVTSLSTFSPPLVLVANISFPSGRGGFRSDYACLGDGSITPPTYVQSTNMVGAVAVEEGRYGSFIGNESGSFMDYNNYINDGATPDDYHRYRFSWNADSAIFYRDDVSRGKLTSYVPNMSLPMWFLADNWAGSLTGHPDSIIDVGWVGVCEYASSDATPLLGSEETFTDFSVPWGTDTYHVTTISNSTLTDFNFSQPSKQISFNVNGSSGTVGFCNVSIPKSLLKDNPWTITIDGAPITDLIQSENDTHTFLHFNYTMAGTCHIIITGTWAVPEFPSSLILPLFMVATLLTVIIHRRKRGGTK
jgi:hypothetical protein